MYIHEGPLCKKIGALCATVYSRTRRMCSTSSRLERR
ncbi:hypothetical protein PG2000B_0690 [Bifidobacterium pseudolongum subsp. globosum]|nr:hypothetical protein PG2000B_0690 [Bifidobacterium pseudolongum subsp. globosum]